MDSKKIAQFIRELRIEKGLSQYQLADMIPISRQAVSKWERGVTIPDSSTLLVLSKIFDISINELLLGRKLTSEDSEANIQNTITLSAVDDVRKKARTIKKLRIGIIVSILLFFNIFLVYYLVNSYNSIKVFTITGESDNFRTKNGIFITTKNKVYFRLGNFDYDENININEIELYYLNNNEKKRLFLGNINNILIIDDDYYEEYFPFDNLNNIIDNLYIRIKFNDDNYEDIHLTLKKSFANDNLFFKKNKSPQLENNETDIPVFSDKDKINEILNKLDCEDDMCSLEFDEDGRNITYAYMKNGNLLNITDNSESIIIEWSYYINSETIDYIIYENGEEIQYITINLNEIDTNDENYKYVEQFYNDYLIKHLS